MYTNASLSHKCIINMYNWMKNQITDLYNAVSAPVAATRDALTEQFQGVCDTASLLYVHSFQITNVFNILTEIST